MFTDVYFNMSIQNHNLGEEGQEGLADDIFKSIQIQKVHVNLSK